MPKRATTMSDADRRRADAASNGLARLLARRRAVEERERIEREALAGPAFRAKEAERLRAYRARRKAEWEAAEARRRAT